MKNGSCVLAQEAGVLAGRDRAVADDVRIGDERRRAVRGRGEAIDDGAIGGEQFARIAQPLIVGRRRHAGQAVVAGRVVVLHLVLHAAHQRHLVHDVAHARQHLADGDAGGRAGDGPIDAANLGRASGFMSKVSRWLGPPYWCRKMTDLARTCGFRRQGPRQVEAEEPGRRRGGGCDDPGWWNPPARKSSPPQQKLFRVHQCPHDIFERARRSLAFRPAAVCALRSSAGGCTRQEQLFHDLRSACRRPSGADAIVRVASACLQHSPVRAEHLDKARLGPFAIAAQQAPGLPKAWRKRLACPLDRLGRDGADGTPGSCPAPRAGGLAGERTGANSVAWAMASSRRSAASGGRGPASSASRRPVGRIRPPRAGSPREVDDRCGPGAGGRTGSRCKSRARARPASGSLLGRVGHAEVVDRLDQSAAHQVAQTRLACAAAKNGLSRSATQSASGTQRSSYPRARASGTRRRGASVGPRAADASDLARLVQIDNLLAVELVLVELVAAVVLHDLYCTRAKNAASWW